MLKNKLINKERKIIIRDNKKNYKVEIKIKENQQKLKQHTNKIIKRKLIKQFKINNNNKLWDRLCVPIHKIIVLILEKMIKNNKVVSNKNLAIMIMMNYNKKLKLNYNSINNNEITFI